MKLTKTQKAQLLAWAKDQEKREPRIFYVEERK